MKQCYNCGNEMIEGDTQYECGCGAIVPRYVNKQCPLIEDTCARHRCMWWNEDKHCCIMQYIPHIYDAVNIRG